MWQLHEQLKTMKMNEAWLELSMRDICINSNLNPLTKFTSSSRSTESKDILPWNISQMIMKTAPISTKIVKLSDELGYPHCEFNGKSMETETTTWSEFSNEGKAIKEQILASKEMNSKEQACENRSGIQVGKLVIWVRLFEIRTEFTKSISYTRIAKPVLMMDIKVSKDKHITRWVDWEKFIYVRWNKI